MASTWSRASRFSPTSSSRRNASGGKARRHSRPASTPSCSTSRTTERGFGKGGTGVLSVDGKQVDSKKMPYSIPFMVSMDESFDVGVDTRYGVDDNDYQPPFRFTGKLNKLTIQLVPPERTAEEEDLLRQRTRKSSTRAIDGNPRGNSQSWRKPQRALDWSKRPHERALYEAWRKASQAHRLRDRRRTRDARWETFKRSKSRFRRPPRKFRVPHPVR